MRQPDFEIADRISDRIVDVLNDEIGKMRASGDMRATQLLAGQLLAFCALEQTMPPWEQNPGALRLLRAAVHTCLESLEEHEKHRAAKGNGRRHH
jgi:hypothetical protein